MNSRLMTTLLDESQHICATRNEGINQGGRARGWGVVGVGGLGNRRRSRGLTLGLAAPLLIHHGGKGRRRRRLITSTLVRVWMQPVCFWVSRTDVRRRRSRSRLANDFWEREGRRAVEGGLSRGAAALHGAVLPFPLFRRAVIKT